MPVYRINVAGACGVQIGMEVLVKVGLRWIKERRGFKEIKGFRVFKGENRIGFMDYP